jgi:hypothetical protein
MADEESARRRVPRIAVGTGAALAAIVAVALYLWLPTTPRGSLADKPAPKTEATPAPPNLSVPTRDEAARPEAEKARETSIAPAPATVTPARPSPLPREPDRAKSAGVAPSGAREDAEQARIRMTAARQAAERVAAGFYARKRFASAQSKERDGVAALGKLDYATAVGLFAEAQAEYQAAMAEAPREEDNERQLAQLRAGLDQAHAAVAARRQQALAAEADQLARDLFDQAQARQVEGDGLASRKDLAAAARAYRDAAERYGEAAARARATRSGK